jgi:outer membrane immunogenic protein
MKKILLAGVAALGFGSTAVAADLPARMPVKAPPMVAPVFSWTGIYAGLNAGGGWMKDSVTPDCFTPAGVYFGTGCTIVPAPSLKPSGFIGGGQIGGNYQVNQWVFGVEADLQGSTIKDSVSINGPFAIVGGGTGVPGDVFTASEQLNWFGTVRGRFGWAADRALFYVTGGFAAGEVEVSTNTAFTSGISYPVSAKSTQTGWTAGGGIEYAFDPSWSAKIEGLYYDLGSVSILTGSVPLPATGFRRGATFDLTGAIVRAGINYRFNWGGPVVP